jgi:perosamine synthetase
LTISRTNAPTALAIHGGSPVRPHPVSMTAHINAATRQQILALLDNHELLSDYYGGRHTRRLEEKFARYQGSGYAVAVNSGTSALHVALAAAGVGPGDEVIVPALCFVAAATAVIQLGGVPVICDAESRHLTIDVRMAETLITERTKAILPVHFWGYPADLPALRALCDRHRLVLIEDACQAPGAAVGAAKTGTFGDFAAYSFCNRKHIHSGEGGLVMCRSPEGEQTVRSLVNYGKGPGWDDYLTLGYSYRMAELSALICLDGLAKLDQEIAARQAAAEMYEAALAGVELATVPAPGWGTSVYFKMPLMLPERLMPHRAFVVDALNAENVSCRIPHRPLFAIPWLIDYLKRMGRYRGAADCQVTASVYPRLLEVETGPHLPREEAVKSVAAVQKVWQTLAEAVHP